MEKGRPGPADSLLGRPGTDQAEILLDEHVQEGGRTHISRKRLWCVRKAMSTEIAETMTKDFVYVAKIKLHGINF